MRAAPRRQRPAWQAPFRSMSWLRSAGLAYRIRAFVVLVSFAIGSLLARDALLVQQTLLLRAAALEDSAARSSHASAPSLETASETRVTKLRPSGISRRAAMNPWDPPDDDDELDQDSDTVAAGYATLAVLPAAQGDEIAAASVTGVVTPIVVAAASAHEPRAGIWSRGPPV